MFSFNNYKVNFKDKEGNTSEEKKVNCTDKEILMNYRIEDLFYGHHSNYSLGRFRIHGHSAYFLYIFRVFKYLYVAIYMDWTIIFRHPINFFVLVIFFSISVGLLFVLGFFIPVYSAGRYLLRSKRNTVIASWKEILGKNKTQIIL